MLCAIIDVGSNSIRLCIYQYDKGGIYPLIDKKETAGLAGYVEGGKLSEKGMKKAGYIIDRFCKIARNFGIAQISVFATASLRNVKNQEEALRCIEILSGIRPEILSGEEEARFDFVGATHFLENNAGLVVDIGGGSTELIRFSDRKADRLCSFPLGSYNLYTEHVGGIFPDRQERKAIRSAVRKELDALRCIEEEPVRTLCGVGGTIRAFRRLCLEVLDVDTDAKTLAAGCVEELDRMLKEGDLETHRRFYKIVPERMLNIEPGLILLREIVDRFGIQEIAVSHYGVREGYLIERVLRH